MLCIDQAARRDEWVASRKHIEDQMAEKEKRRFLEGEVREYMRPDPLCTYACLCLWGACMCVRIGLNVCMRLCQCLCPCVYMCGCDCAYGCVCELAFPEASQPHPTFPTQQARRLPSSCAPHVCVV